MLYNTHGSVDATLWPTIDTEEHFTAKKHTHTPVYLRILSYSVAARALWVGLTLRDLSVTT